MHFIGFAASALLTTTAAAVELKPGDALYAKLDAELEKAAGLLHDPNYAARRTQEMMYSFSYSGGPGVCCYNGDSSCVYGYDTTGYCAESPGKCADCGGLFFTEVPESPSPAGVCCFGKDPTCSKDYATEGFCTWSADKCEGCNGVLLDSLPETEDTPAASGVCCYDNSPLCTSYSEPGEHCSLSAENCAGCNGLFLAELPPVEGLCCWISNGNFDIDQCSTDRNCAMSEELCDGCGGGTWFPAPTAMPTVAPSITQVPTIAPTGSEVCCYGMNPDCFNGYTRTGWCAESAENCGFCNGVYLDSLPYNQPGTCCYNFDPECKQGFDFEGYCALSEAHCTSCGGYFYNGPTKAPTPEPSTSPTPSPTLPPVCCVDYSPTCEKGITTDPWCLESAENCDQCGGLYFKEMPEPAETEPGVCCWDDAGTNCDAPDSTCSSSKSMCETSHADGGCNGYFFAADPSAARRLRGRN